MRGEAEIRGELVRRLTPLHPELVLLFGSRASGRASADSDYDVIVVAGNVPDNPADRIARARRLLRGIGVSVDLLVYSPDEWRRHRDAAPSFAHAAWTTGQVLHAG